jgi:hypothetical protein
MAASRRDPARRRAVAVLGRAQGYRKSAEIDEAEGRPRNEGRGKLGRPARTAGPGRRGVTPLPEPGEGDTRSEIIFDPDTGRFLAERDVLVNRVDYLDANPGAVIGWAAYLESAVVDSVTERPD